MARSLADGNASKLLATTALVASSLSIIGEPDRSANSRAARFEAAQAPSRRTCTVALLRLSASAFAALAVAVWGFMPWECERLRVVLSNA